MCECLEGGYIYKMDTLPRNYTIVNTSYPKLPGVPPHSLAPTILIMLKLNYVRLPDQGKKRSSFYLKLLALMCVHAINKIRASYFKIFYLKAILGMLAWSKSYTLRVNAMQKTLKYIVILWTQK